MPVYTVSFSAEEEEGSVIGGADALAQKIAEGVASALRKWGVRTDVELHRGTPPLYHASTDD